MKKKPAHLQRIATAFLVSLLTAAPLAAQFNEGPTANQIDKIFSQLPGPASPTELDRTILDGMKVAKVPGLAAAIVKNGQIAWTGYYGWANIENKTAVSKNTFFQVASVSKTVTACVIMQRVEAGKLSLDTDLDPLIPFSVRHPQYPDTPITLKHLLTHTAGVKDNWNVLEETWVKNDDFPHPLGVSLANYFKPTGPYYNVKKNYYKWEVGSKSQYSNVGIALAAYVAETTAKVSFEKLCEENIFKPLGMTGSSFRLAGMDRSRLAMPYAVRKKSGQLKALGHHGYLDFPAGTLRTSAPQLARFLLCFIGHGKIDDVRILKESTVRQMQTVPFANVAPKQGLVWYYDKVGGSRVLAHDGSDPGVTALICFRPRDGSGFVLMMNAEPKNRQLEAELARQFFAYADRL